LQRCVTSNAFQARVPLVRCNRAIHTIALTQISHDPRARAYLERKREAGKSRKDAMRCLKRHLARVIYRRLVVDGPVLPLT